MRVIIFMKVRSVPVVVWHKVAQFAAHSSTIETSALPVAAAFGFVPGLPKEEIML